MPQLEQRLANLSPERRELLEKFLAAGASTPALGKNPPASNIRQPLGPLKEECRRLYDDVNRQLDESEFAEFSLFLNLGYLANEVQSESPIVLSEHCINRNSVQLVLEVIGASDLATREVLDVGCGRGGTISVMKQFFTARRICGIDLAPAAINFCRSNYRYPEREVTFEVGDAEQLSFADGSYDIVTNIESSSTYPDTFAFYREVFRVLGKNGLFLYTDALPVERFSECSEYLRRIGFRLESDRDITANVLASCDEVASHRRQAYETQTDGSLNDFLGTPGSHFYNEMKSGRWTYRIQRWRKSSRVADEDHGE